MKRQVIRFLAAYSWVYPAVNCLPLSQKILRGGTKRVDDALSNELYYLCAERVGQCGSDRPTCQMLHANEDVAIALGRQR